MNEPDHPIKGRPEGLDDLQLWKVEVPIPPRFQAEVWQKIAASQAQRPVWNRWVEWLELALLRPQFAAALILLAGITGGGLAQYKVHQVNARSFRALEAQYVASIDPYAHPAKPAMNMP